MRWFRRSKEPGEKRSQGRPPRETLSQLSDQLSALRLYATEGDFAPWYEGAEEAYDHFRRSMAHLCGKLGENKYLKLCEMLEQARKHIEAGGIDNIKLGSWLMQDMSEVIRNGAPFAYPPDMWRWGERGPAND